jgi:hypothetical protein
LIHARVGLTFARMQTVCCWLSAVICMFRPKGAHDRGPPVGRGRKFLTLYGQPPVNCFGDTVTVALRLQQSNKVCSGAMLQPGQTYDEHTQGLPAGHKRTPTDNNPHGLTKAPRKRHCLCTRSLLFYCCSRGRPKPALNCTDKIWPGIIPKITARSSNVCSSRCSTDLRCCVQSQSYCCRWHCK